MENASKALLMAAGLLISVIVLSLIVFIYITFSNSTQQSVKQMELSKLTAFNSKYLNYDGRKDLTFYDIVNVVSLAKSDNENSDYGIKVKFFSASSYSSLDLTDKTISIESLKQKLTALNRDGDVMESKEIEDTSTGGKAEKIVPVNYECKVKLNEKTGRVEEVSFRKK